MSSVTVKVNNKEYKLKGDEREEYLHAVATYVDKKIKNIMENNSKLSTAEASILTALNLADDLFKAGYYNEELSDEIEKLKSNIKNTKVEIDELKEELTKVNEEKEQLLVKVEELKINEDTIEKDKQIEALTEEVKLKKQNNEKYLNEINRLKSDNKDLKFKMQSAKYKLMDLENKYLEGQIALAKTKKEVIKSINKK